MADLKKGDRAPELRYLDPNGGELRNWKFDGRPTVVVFYPRAGSATCNAELADFSALHGRFRELCADVLAISPDGAAKLRNFSAKHGTQVNLASDPEAENARRWGTWIEKSMYGRTFLGVERATFLIDASGRIAGSWRKVRVGGHATDVLEAVEKLLAEPNRN